MGRYADEHLVQHGREEKDGDARDKGAPPAPDHGRVDVASEVLRDGLVPRAPVGAEAGAVPPVVVERPVTEAHDLGEGVEERLEQGEEAGEPDDEGNGRQLHEALHNVGDVKRGNLVERVEKNGRSILRACEPDEDAQTKDLAQAFGDEDPPNLVGAWVGGLVDEGGRPPEVHEVAHRDVLGVRALLVDLGHGVELTLDGMEVGVTEVAVGECVRGRLEPDNDGMELGQSADQGVVNVEIHNERRDRQGERDVESVRPGDDLPCRLEPGALVMGRTRTAVFGLDARPARLVCGNEFDEIGGEEMAWDEKVEAQAKKDVRPAKVMAVETYQDAILRKMLDRGSQDSRVPIDGGETVPFAGFQSSNVGFPQLDMKRQHVNLSHEWP